jgi:hypothetical protein
MVSGGSDRYGGQLGWAQKENQVCLAHLIRDAQFAIDAGDEIFNGSQRALRPCAVFRKITNGFRTEWGAKLYANIRSVIETGRRRGIGALHAVRLTLAGQPLQPAQ